jgi:hypothetical protein
MVTKLLSDEKSFRLRIVKDIYLDLLDIDEAEQVAEIIASRESQMTTFGKMTSVYTEVESV